MESRVRENLTHGSERGRWKHDLPNQAPAVWVLGGWGDGAPAAYSTLHLSSDGPARPAPDLFEILLANCAALRERIAAARLSQKVCY